MEQNEEPTEDGVELPPFEIPADYLIEQELAAPLPRSIPDRLRRHPARLKKLARARVGGGAILLLAILSFVFRESDFFVALGLYFTPFSNLHWVAPIMALIGLWGVTGFWTPWQADPFLYLREGLTLVGQVVDLRLEVASRVNGSDSTYAYDVYFQFLDPETEELSVIRLRSTEFGGSQHLNCRVGDFLTAVYLPGALETLTLYGFTGIDPDKDLMTKGSSTDAKAAVLFLGGILALLWVGSSYGISETPQSFWLSLVPLTLLGGWKGYLAARDRDKVLEEEFNRAVQEGLPVKGETHQKTNSWFFPPLYALGGALLSVILVLSANGLFDRSKPEITTLEVEDTICTTYQFLFKTYQVKYKDPKTGQSTEDGVSPLEFMAPGPLKAELHSYQGALGWSWEEVRIRPWTAEELQQIETPSDGS